MRQPLDKQFQREQKSFILHLQIEGWEYREKCEGHNFHHSSSRKCTQWWSRKSTKSLNRGISHETECWHSILTCHYEKLGYYLELLFPLGSLVEFLLVPPKPLLITTFTLPISILWFSTNITVPWYFKNYVIRTMPKFFSVFKILVDCADGGWQEEDIGNLENEQIHLEVDDRRSLQIVEGHVRGVAKEAAVDPHVGIMFPVVVVLRFLGLHQ